MIPAGRSVLIVDDDEDVLVLLDHALAAHRFEVATATSVRQALSLMEGQHFDAVVTDKNMPGGSGLELVRGVALKYPNTAVLLMTAHPEGRVNKLPIDGYLPKPFKSLHDVRDTLERALARRAVRRKLDSVKADLERSSRAPGESDST